MTTPKKSKKVIKPKPIKKAVKKAFVPLQSPPVEPIKPIEPVEVTYHVAPGKSITSKKGILGPGKQVKIEYLNGGQKTIDQRIESGHIIKG